MKNKIHPSTTTTTPTQKRLRRRLAYLAAVLALGVTSLFSSVLTPDPVSAAVPSSVSACFSHTNGNPYTYQAYLMYWDAKTSTWKRANAPVLTAEYDGCTPSWSNLTPGYYYRIWAYNNSYGKVFSGWSPYYDLANGGYAYLGRGSVNI